MKELLKKILAQINGATKIVFLGLGEARLTDDAVGPYIITQFLEHNSDKYLFINGGIDPMARIDEIIAFSPSHLILIDTCTYNASPGTVVFLNRDNLSEYVPISSHTIPIHIVLDLIANKIPELKIFMIGIVPESLEGFDEWYLFKRGELTIDEFLHYV